jgi:transglutaminase-like putative cysteine protease
VIAPALLAALLAAASARTAAAPGAHDGDDSRPGDQQHGGTESAETAVQREAKAVAAELEETTDAVGAAVLLYRIEELLPHLGPVVEPLHAAEVAASRFSSRARAHPSGTEGETLALAQRVSLVLEQARGRPARAAERAQQLQLATSWALLETTWVPGGSCGTEAPPPTFHPKATPGTIAWRSLPNVARAGRLELDDLLSDRRDAAAVAAVEVDVQKPADAAFYYGASGPSAVAVDGVWIAADATQHPAHDDQLRVPVRLSAGAHLVEIQVCRAERPLELRLRVAAANGGPLAHAALILPTDQPPAGKSRPPKLAAPQRGGRLLAAALANASAEGLDAAASLREALEPDEASDRLATLARRKACQAADSQACWIRLARDAERDRRSLELQQALAAAQKLGPPTEELELALGRESLDLGYPDRALTHTLEAERLDPRDDRPVLLHAQLLETLGLTGLAAKLELDAGTRWPLSPDAQLAAAYRLERLGRRQKAVRQLRVLLGLRPDLLGAREQLKRLLLLGGDLDGALEQLVAERQLLPAAAQPLVESGALLLANPLPGSKGTDRRTLADQALREAMRLAPSNADVLGQVAAAELRDGDPALGRQIVQRALALRPQAQALGALNRQLTERHDAFAVPYLADLVATAKASPPIPQEDAVLLSDVTAIQVYPSGLASRVHQILVRVQTERGAEAARSTPIDFDPGRQDLQIEAARILKPDGHMVSTYEESTRSLSEPWYDLYYDQRERDVAFPTLAAGDVLEVTYRLDDTARDNLLSDDFGDLTFLQDTVYRERFTYAVAMPLGRELHANDPKLAGLQKKVELRPDGGRTYVWTAREIGRIQPEPEMPGWAEVAPYLHVSTQEDWAQLGDSYWRLVHDQLAPSDQLSALAASLEKSAGEDPAARIRAAYDYVVSKTRYVGLEFGIHGYKPYPVGEILSRGFGDCKDKASLLWSLLHAMGIDSRLVLLRTRRLGRIGASPASLAIFDHAILYVPSIDRFLDGTARFFGSTELPADDQGASALVVEPGGKSRLVTTPFVPAEDNGTSSDLLVKLAPDGSALLRGTAEIDGSLAADYRRSYQSEAGRRAVFEEGWSRSYPGLAVQDVRFEPLTSLETPVKIQFELAVPHFAVKRGATWTFDPFGKGATYLETFAALAKRRFEVALPPPFATHFRYQVEAPAGTRFGERPADVTLDAPFGKLHIGYRLAPPADVAPPQLVIDGELSLTAARISPDQYGKFRRFLQDTDRAFAQPLELVGSEKLNAARN